MAPSDSSRTHNQTRRKTVVAFGGESPEHEVSVITALQAMDALKSTNYLDLVPFYVSKQGEWFTGEALFSIDSYQDLPKLTASLSRCTFRKDPLLGACMEVESTSSFSWFGSRPNRIPLDVVVMAFHGAAGENGAFQGLFETVGVPYTGSGVLSSSTGMNKVTAKKLAMAAGVEVVPWIDFSEQEWVADQESFETKASKIGFPLIVKPVHLGSSIGISTASTPEEFRRAVEMCLRFDAHVMAEKKIEPLLEINCSVLGNGADSRASVCERPMGTDEILSFSDKYLTGGSKGMASTSRVIPADISTDLTRKIQEQARILFRELECAGVARFDFILKGTTENASEVYFNEVNTIPGSFSFYLWKESGLHFGPLLLELISIAKRVHNTRSGRSFSFENNLLKHRQKYGSKKLGK